MRWWWRPGEASRTDRVSGVRDRQGQCGDGDRRHRTPVQGPGAGLTRGGASAVLRRGAAQLSAWARWRQPGCSGRDDVGGVEPRVSCSLRHSGTRHAHCCGDESWAHNAAGTMVMDASGRLGGAVLRAGRPAARGQASRHGAPAGASGASRRTKGGWRAAACWLGSGCRTADGGWRVWVRARARAAGPSRRRGTGQATRQGCMQVTRGVALRRRRHARDTGAAPSGCH